jgi:hypothetical protein
MSITLFAIKILIMLKIMYLNHLTFENFAHLKLLSLFNRNNLFQIKVNGKKKKIEIINYLGISFYLFYS